MEKTESLLYREIKSKCLISYYLKTSFDSYHPNEFNLIAVYKYKYKYK